MMDAGAQYVGTLDRQCGDVAPSSGAVRRGHTLTDEKA